MYRFCRGLLIVGTMELAFAVSVGIAGVGPWAWTAVVVAAFVGLAKRGKQLLWAHGTARWASEIELRKAGMIDGEKGLMVGRLGHSKRPNVFQVFPTLLDRRAGAKEACDQFLRVLSPTKRGRLVRLS